MILRSIISWALFTAVVSAAPLGNYASHAVLSSTAAIEITDNIGNRLRLRAYGDDMIRVQASETATFSPDDRYQMVEHHNHGGTLSILSNTASSLVIANGDIRLTVSKSPLRLSFADATGNVMLSDSSGINLDPVTLTYNFAPDNAEKFIGYGQKRLALQDTFQLAGRTERRNYGEEGFPGRGAQGVLIVPFYMSSKGYGFYANTTFTHEGRFNNAGDYSFRVELKNFAPPEADYFFIYGPKPAAILDQYTQLTGRPRMPRKAIFGLQLSDNEPSQPTINQAWWQTEVAEHFAAGYPLDHMVYDNDWRAASPLTGGQVGQWGGSQFAFDPTRYPDPASFRTWYDAQGLTLTLDLNLNNCNDSAGWQPSYNIPPFNATNTATSATSDPDYSNPATRAWLWQLFWDKALNPALGYPGDAIWLDESDGIYRPDNQLLANGRTWHEMKNYYFFLTAQAAVAEGWDNAEGGTTPGIGEAKRPWIWIRGGGPGMQRYASHWTGDIEFSTSFWKGNIIGMQASGLAGFPFYNHDAGSFGSSSTTPDPDPDAKISGPNDNYYIQWACALGSFSPVWRPHGYGQPRWPGNRNLASQTAFRRYAQQRYEMMPYTYSMAHLAHDSGLPMARPMPLAFPDSPDAWHRDQEYQYMWGDSMLVVTNFLLNGSDEIRTAWLPPAANWYDFWTDTPVGNGTSGSFHTFNARFGFLPLFIKAGAIIPRQDFALTTAALTDTKLTLDVYKGDSGTYNLVEDDGVTERFRTVGEKRRTSFTYTETASPAPAVGTFQIGAATGTYNGASANRSYIVRLHGLTAAPLQVTVNGTPVTVQTAPLPAGDTTAAAWDASARLALVRLSSRAVTATATVALTFPDTPATPTLLAATTASSSQINLTWTDNSTNETGFTLLRRTGTAGIFAPLTTLPANSTSYTDTGLEDQTQYFYRVAATNANGDSAFTPEASATTLPIPPLAPAGLASTTLALDTIRLTWADQSDNETGFFIERSLTLGGPFVFIATVGTGVTTFDDTGRPANSNFFYRVAATNSVGDSPYSSTISGTTVPPSPPAAPTSLSATVGIGTQISLTWNDASTNELGFKLQRKTGAGGTYAQIASLPAGTTSYSDIGLTGSTVYFYRIAATNLGGDSAFSNEVSATTPVIGIVTLTSGDGSPFTSFNEVGRWSNSQAPSAANDYITNGNMLRTPHNSSGNIDFAGNSLTISTNGSLLQKGINQSSITVNALKLNGGRIRNGTADTIQTVFGNIQVVANSILDPNSNGRSIVLAAPLSGSGNLTLDSSEGNGGVLRLAVDNPGYTGNWTIPNVANKQPTLQVGVGGTAGSLGSGTVTNNVALIFNRSDAFTVSNPISGSGTVTLTGSGTLTLLGTHSYTGATNLTGGTLLVNGTLGNTAVTVGFSTLLGGTGTIGGSVSVLGDFAPGANGIGTLTVNNAATLSGGSTFEINTASTPTHDRLVATGALNVAGALTLVNTGPALVAGDTFALFNKAPGGNFATVTLPALGPDLVWQNNIAVDGTLTVLGTNPPGLASNPVPANASTGISPRPALSWTPGINASSHRVYLGTDQAAVTSATPATVGIYQGQQATTTFTPAADLATSTQYFWRIDQVGPGGVSTGPVWSFTTAAFFVSAKEPFDYPLAATLTTRNGGIGWRGAWLAATNAAVIEPLIVGAGLTYPNLVTTGNALRDTSGTRYANSRPWFDPAVPIPNGTTVWFSALVSYNNNNSSDLLILPFGNSTGTENTNGIGVAISTKITANGTADTTARVYLRSAFTNLGLGGLPTTAGLVGAPIGTPFLVVGRFTLSSTANADTLDIWVNPTAAPTADSSLRLTGFTAPRTPATSAGNFVLYSGYSAQSSIDELALSTTYADVTSNFNPTTPFASWMAGYPTLTGNDALTGSDPDGDGLNNLGEFAFGSNPASGASDGGPAGKFGNVNGSQVFTITIPARSGAVFTSGAPATSAPIDGLIYQVQSGTTLDAWTIPVQIITGPDATTIQSTLPSPPPGYSYHTFRPDLPPGSARAFVRARISGAGE